jgi:hypothetical protein
MGHNHADSASGTSTLKLATIRNLPKELSLRASKLTKTAPFFELPLTVRTDWWRNCSHLSNSTK